MIKALKSLGLVVATAMLIGLSVQYVFTQSGFWTNLETNNIIFEGATVDGFETTLSVTDPTADRTATLPDATGTMVVVNSGSAALDFASVTDGCSADLTITVTGAALNDEVILGVPNGSVNATSVYTAWVSAADTVTVQHCDFTAGASDPASGTFTASVLE